MTALRYGRSHPPAIRRYKVPQRVCGIITTDAGLFRVYLLEVPLATGDDMVRITYNGGYQAIPPNLKRCIAAERAAVGWRKRLTEWRARGASNYTDS